MPSIERAHFRLPSADDMSHRIRNATPVQKAELAAVIHLCGAGAGNDYVQRGFKLLTGQRCGDQQASVYVARIDAMQAEFVQLAAKD